MTPSKLEQQDLEQHLLRLPPMDKLRIIELLVKSLSQLWQGDRFDPSAQSSPSQTSPAGNQSQTWPELVRSLSGAWSDFPDITEIRAGFAEDAPRETL